MKALLFREWLDRSPYTPNSVNTRYAYAKKVEEAYGDLDTHYENDRLKGLIANLAYSQTDAKANIPNPTKITVGGNPYNVLNNCKTGVRSYRSFLEAHCNEESAVENAAALVDGILDQRRDSKQFEFEHHLQAALRAEIEQLEQGLKIIDDGVERAVESGSIDILAQDTTGALVVIELKRGTAKRESIGQILGYMGDLKLDEAADTVRGILVAADFDKSCQSAVAMVPNLTLRSYRYKFFFEAVVRP